MLQLNDKAADYLSPQGLLFQGACGLIASCPLRVVHTIKPHSPSADFRDSAHERRACGTYTIRLRSLSVLGETPW
jgi:hypothetical protein